MAQTPILLDGFTAPRGRRRSTSMREMRAKFDAAQTNDNNTRHWANADLLGPNSEIEPGIRRTLRSRSRYECANNAYAAGMIRTLANDTIGTGPAVQITDPRFKKEQAAEIENAFWDWCLAVRLPEKLRLMRAAKARDGETFAQIFENPRLRNPVRLDFNPFEADCVATTEYGDSRLNILDGLIVDEYGNVLAYNVLKQHPGENYSSMLSEAEPIPADEIIHLFHSTRPGQMRGVPEITPALPLFAQLRRYTLAVIRSAESAAEIAWFLKTMQAPSDFAYDAESWDTLETNRGMGMVLPEGYDVSQLKAEQPTSTYAQFKREILTEIARCLSIPYNVAAGDSSSYNYSSGRLDHRSWYKVRGVERADIEHSAIDVLFRNWWDAARNLDAYLPEVASEIAWPAHVWRWDGDEHVDPTKEADAAVTRVSYGMTALTDEIGRLGGDIEVVHRKNAEALGLTYDDYRKRLADKFFGAMVASSSQEQPEEPPASPYDTGARNG